MNDKNFIDWENYVFGFGYGTGEEYTLKALKTFLYYCKLNGYGYHVLETTVTPTVAWLLINILCHADILEYGTSLRFGWLTEKGKLLRKFMLSKTEDELYEMVNVDQDYVYCYPDYCNCDLPKGVTCNNPLFKAS